MSSENEELKTRLEKVEKDLEKESKMRRDGEVSLVGAMTTIKDQQERLQELTEAAQPRRIWWSLLQTEWSPVL